MQLAEVVRAYSNFRIPALDRETLSGSDDGQASLVAQAEGLLASVPAADLMPAHTKRVAVHMDDVVSLYEAGESLSAIARKVGISWDSVARLLDKAGVRKQSIRP